MNLDGYVSMIEFRLGGGILDLELDSAQIGKIVEHSLVELQRYISNTKLVTVPFKSVIDMKEYDCSDVRFVYVANPNYGLQSPYSTGETYGDNTDAAGNPSIYANTPIDPMAWSAYFLGSAGQISNYTNYVDQYYSYVQTRKSLNTGDLKRLTFNYNKQSETLYLNNNVHCGAVTIEYVPRLLRVDDVTNDAWIDILFRYALANAKIILGRIRSRFTQTNALWESDGPTLLQEGNTELAELRTYLDNSASILKPR